MNEFAQILNKYITLREEPTIWLPIVALIIAWLLASKAIRSLQKDKCRQRLELTQQELSLLLLGAYRKIAFLSFLVVFVSWSLLFITMRMKF